MTQVFTGSVQQRHNTAAYLLAENRVLLAGEVAWETDTLKSKLGDGATAYAFLPYTTTGGGGGGVTTFSALADRASVDLPSTNAPLAAALAAKPTSFAGLSDKSTIDLTTVNAPLAAALATKASSFVTLSDKTTVDLPGTNAPLAAALAAKPTAFSGLTDKTTVDLPSTNVPLSSALALKAPFKVAVAYSTTIPLDTDGNGKYMPVTPLVANSVFSVGAGPIEQGNCNFALVGDGTHVPDFSAFVNANGYAYISTVNATNIYSAVYTYNGTALLYGVRGVDGSAGAILAEDGSFILSEDSFHILQG